MGWGGAEAADEAQGEQLALVAALESLPALYASPLASLAFGVWLHQPWVVLAIAAGVLLVAMLLLWLCVRRRDHCHEHSAALLAGVDPGAAPFAEAAADGVVASSSDVPPGRHWHGAPGPGKPALVA